MKLIMKLAKFMAVGFICFLGLVIGVAAIGSNIETEQDLTPPETISFDPNANTSSASDPNMRKVETFDPETKTWKTKYVPKSNVEKFNPKAEVKQFKLKRQKAQKGKIENYMSRIEKEFNGTKGPATREMLETTDSIHILLAVLQAWAAIIKEADDYELTKEQKSRVEELAAKYKKLQARDLPKVRDAYGPAARKALWESDMSAKTFGKGFRTIEFTGVVFARNANIKAFHEKWRKIFYMMRFKQVRYRWSKHATEYTYFDLDSDPDGDLIAWDTEGMGYTRVR